jgi:hypothetical protein
MVFGGWALFTGVSHILAARRANVEDTDRGPMTTMGGVVTVVGLILLIWPGTKRWCIFIRGETNPHGINILKKELSRCRRQYYAESASSPSIKKSISTPS